MKQQEEKSTLSNIETVKAGNPALKVKLTKSILDGILPNEIIYAEVAGGGAMGNAGGVMIYIIQKEKLICYETNVFSDEEVYKEAEALFARHKERSTKETPQVQEKCFKSYYGGMGNYVFINKDVGLKSNEGYFTYLNDGFEYKIYSSVKGVFISIVNRIHSPNNETP